MLAVLPPNSLMLAIYQVDKYKDLLEIARQMGKPVEERAFLRKELYNAKQRLKTFYN